MNIEDRELLIFAAKAVGEKAHYDEMLDEVVIPDANGRVGDEWHPLIDDGDASRLAAKLGLSAGFDDRFKDLGACAYCTYPTGEYLCNSIMQNIEDSGGSESATRRAIVRAAAEMGRLMP